MSITERQREILNSVVEEYIHSAEPASSQLLEKKYRFGISPATIRNEMQKLTDAELLYQPHTSAGRIPTDKGYRFYVDDLLERGNKWQGEEDKSSSFPFAIAREGEEVEDTIRFVQSLTKQLAAISSNLALGCLFKGKIFWKEGWEKIFQEPEFKKTELIPDFFNLLEEFEEDIEDFKVNSGIKIYIGKENPFPKAKDFSIILSGCYFPGKERGILAILGPKRMPYDKNINSLNYLIKLLEEF